MTSRPTNRISSHNWFRLVAPHAKGIGWILVGLTLFGLGIKTSYYGAKSTSWPSTAGVIQTSKVVKQRNNGRTTFHWDFDYTYVHDGMQYQASKVSFGVTSLSVSPSQLADKYSKGKAVRVFFNPDDPSIAVLERGITDGSHVLLLASFACLTWGTSPFIFKKQSFRIGLTIMTICCMHLLSQLYIVPSETRRAMQIAEEAGLQRQKHKALREYEQNIRLDQMKLSGKFLISDSLMSSFEFRQDGTGTFHCGFLLQFGNDEFEIPFKYKQTAEQLEIIQVNNGARLTAHIAPLGPNRLDIRNVVAEEELNHYLSDFLDKGMFLRTNEPPARVTDD